jgi:hypothetical protein
MRVWKSRNPKRGQLKQTGRFKLWKMRFSSNIRPAWCAGGNEGRFLTEAQTRHSLQAHVSLQIIALCMWGVCLHGRGLAQCINHVLKYLRFGFPAFQSFVFPSFAPTAAELVN